MRIVSKAISFILLGSILLAACGAVTPVAPTVQVTSTLQPTSTSIVIPSRTPSPIPTFASTPTSFLLPKWHYAPPKLDSTKYKLKPWTEGDYAFFIDAMDKGKLLDTDPLFLQVFDSFYGYEYFLHDHDIDPNNELDWAIARMASVGVSLPGMRQGEGYLNFLLENYINKNHVLLEDLADILRKHGFRVQNTLTVNDFYGKGEDAFFIDIYAYHMTIRDEVGVFAIHQINGTYEVDTIKNWQPASGLGYGLRLSFDYVIDSNKNGYPELVLDEYASHSGLPPQGIFAISLYEWDQQTNTYRSNSFTIYNQWCDESACDGKWELRNSNSQNLPDLVTQENWTTQAPCPTLIMQRTYRWDGQGYPLKETTILPPVVGDTECRVNWAEAAIRVQEHGWQNDQAIQIISDALHAWPADLDKSWGPASRDYFRLHMGIWMDLRGEGDKALELLQPLAAKPFMSEYALPSKTATAYLRGRTKSGILGACQAANKTWDNGIRTDISGNASLADANPNVLGFATVPWDEYFGGFSAICSEDETIYALAQNENKATSANPVTWFTQIGKSVYLSKQEDFDGDGQQDWLVLAEDSRISDWSAVWFFFIHSNHFTVNKLSDEHLDAVTPSKWLILRPEQDGNPIYLLTIGKDIWIFRVTHDGQIETLVDDYNVKLLQIDQAGQIKIRVSYQDPGDQRQRTKNYVWDYSSRTFITAAEEYDFEATKDRVDQMVFQEHNFSTAISFIQQFLAQAPVELPDVSYCDQNGCEHYSQKYYPYMYYMMGLSYEMSDQSEEAARTYYLLWKDYPESPYALLAQSKLTSVAP